MSRLLAVLTHGIMNKTTDPSWPDHFDAYLLDRHPGVKSIKQRYAAGPFPLWNVLWKNPSHAASLVEEIQVLMNPHDRICFVGHSNGTDVNLRAVKMLAGVGIKTDVMVLIGSVVGSDVQRSGILPLIESGALRKAVAYCSPLDSAVGLPLIGVYGRLGKTGFQWGGQDFATSSIFTRWFPGYEHSTYFSGTGTGSPRQDTFEKLWSDMKL